MKATFRNFVSSDKDKPANQRVTFVGRHHARIMQALFRTCDSRDITFRWKFHEWVMQQNYRLTVLSKQWK